MHVSTCSLLFSAFSIPLQPDVNKTSFLVQSSQGHTFLDIHSHNNQLSIQPSTHVFPSSRTHRKRTISFLDPISSIKSSQIQKISLSLEGKEESAAPNSALGICFLDPVITHIHTKNTRASRSVKMRSLLDILCSRTETSRHKEHDMTTQHLCSPTTGKRLAKL